MPLYLDSFRNDHSNGYTPNSRIEGMESFANSLEKLFFAEATILNCTDRSLRTNLAIELNCNISLAEMLFHFNKGTWGSFKPSKTSFIKLINDLITKSGTQVDIEEFTFFLNDTAIVINKIYDNSIPEQLNDVIAAICKHYVHFSKGLTEIPYEIYVPVFEEKHHEENDILITNIETDNNTKKDYFKYWGLYFESEDDAVIYDLKSTTIENGDLFMLNH
ncbi:hypothetical protein Q4603_05310 [Zobellia galactanivorans]|uniref:Uncharacterized protein n=1 Tax=Zobellia galactanivorans (strain DSM 12802 / CCUG 47099 / CIP 106680 / NCIMB 13871 / Dsij) TaxID=63186 RepID=G0L4S6_ZOBGA|nr:hypothetical protein [Zobellia galactanivorans]MBU3027058.1 hypothetical protein [Zobellia galactanivorans]MDO6808012.1 hypothetical protein [Zobellia galactanivorans]CAZ98876.1 Hypothetical protein ZOBELLIA_4741 [Zobellia galactanivorans]